MVETPPTYPQRRSRLKLPRRRWHFLGAIVLLAVTAAALSKIALAPPADIDPNISGQLALEAIPQPLASTNLNSDEDALPDLLAGDVAEGENPTAVATVKPKTDALGNPITSGTNNTGPKTILIDGNPIQSRAASAQLFAELTRNGPFCPLPRRAQNGNTPLKAYGKTANKIAGRQAVSLIIGGLGVNAPLTQQAIDTLPADVTLSFAAHSVGLQEWINKARADGHDVLLEIPMDSANINPSEPGAARTLKANDKSANNHHLDWLLSRAQGYFGVINYNGETFLTRSDAVVPTLDRLSKSGLGLVTDGAFFFSTLGPLTQSVGLPYKQGFGLIDPEPQTALINIELSRLAATATSGSAPIGVGFAYPETLDAVTVWINSLPEQSLQLVPASALLVQ